MMFTFQTVSVGARALIFFTILHTSCHALKFINPSDGSVDIPMSQIPVYYVGQAINVTWEYSADSDSPCDGATLSLGAQPKFNYNISSKA